MFDAIGLWFAVHTGRNRNTTPALNQDVFDRIQARTDVKQAATAWRRFVYQMAMRMKIGRRAN